MDHTNNLHLPQWEADDRIMHDDFNDAFAALDTAVGSLQTAAAGFGNCRIEVKTYTGTGQLNSNQKRTLTFSEAPLVVILIGGGMVALIGKSSSTSSTTVQPLPGTTSRFTATWSGNSVSWNPSVSDGYMMNVSGSAYTAIAVLAPRA